MFSNLTSEKLLNLNAWKTTRTNSKELLETDLHLEQSPFVVWVSVTVPLVSDILSEHGPNTIAVGTRVRLCVKIFSVSFLHLAEDASHWRVIL